MRSFLRQINVTEPTITDVDIISFVFKFFMITAIALLVFFLTTKNYSQISFSEGESSSTTMMLQANPPSPY